MATFIKFTTNAKAAKTRRITHTDGRQYLIAPDIALREGVMNGLLYTQDEVTVYIDAWNGKPLVFGHPVDNAGNPVSANDPEIFSQSPGFFFGAKWDGDALKGEWWVDIEKAKALANGDELIRRLESNEIIEESTGLFADVEPVKGSYNGVPYEGIARNIRPDHLAILLDDIGACSIKDGCGAPRINKDQTMEITIDGDTFVPQIEETPEDEQVQQTAFFEGVFTNVLSKFFRNTQTEDVTVNEERLNQIAALVERGFDQEWLEAASDENLTLLATNNEEGAPPVASEAQPAFELPEEIMQFAQMISDLGGVAALKDALAGMQVNAAQERETLVETVLANSEFEKAELAAMPVSTLRKLAQSYGASAGTPDFSGRNGAINNSQEDNEWIGWGEGE